MICINRTQGLILSTIIGIVAYILNYGRIEEFSPRVLSYVSYNLQNGATYGNLMDNNLPFLQLFGTCFCSLTGCSAEILSYSPIILFVSILTLYELFSKLSHNYVISSLFVGIIILMPSDLRYAGLVGHGYGTCLYYLIIYILVLLFLKKIQLSHFLLITIPIIVVINYASYTATASLELVLLCLLIICISYMIKSGNKSLIYSDNKNMIEINPESNKYEFINHFKGVIIAFLSYFFIIFGLSSFWSTKFHDFVELNVGDANFIEYALNMILSFVGKYVSIIFDVGNFYIQTSIFDSYLITTSMINMLFNTIKLICVYILPILFIYLTIHNNKHNRGINRDKSKLYFIIYAITMGSILYIIVRISVGQLLLDNMIFAGIVCGLYLINISFIQDKVGKIIKNISTVILLLLFISILCSVCIGWCDGFDKPTLQNFNTYESGSMWYYHYGESNIYSDILTRELYLYFVVENLNVNLDSALVQVKPYIDSGDSFISTLNNSNIVNMERKFYLINEYIYTYIIDMSSWTTIYSKYLKENLRNHLSINKIYSNPNISIYS